LKKMIVSINDEDCELPRAHFAGHRQSSNPVYWLLPKGKTVLSHAFYPKFSGQVHYISAHLHRYGLWIQLKEKNSGHILWRGEAKQDSHGYISSIPTYSHTSGFHLEHDQEYLLEASYNNA